MPILEAKDLTVKQGETLALNHFNLSVDQGEVVALIGHNGAGKSTFFKTVMAMIEEQSGTVIVNGRKKDDSVYKTGLVYIPEHPFLLPELTVYQHFQLYLESYHQSMDEAKGRISALAERFEIKDQLDEFPLTLSKGMKQKVQLIAGLIVDTPVLLVDEPFVGLDVYAQETLIDIFKEKKKQNQTIILTTHQFERLDQIMDRYVMLQQGMIVKEGQVDELTDIKRRFEE